MHMENYMYGKRKVDNGCNVWRTYQHVYSLGFRFM